MYIQILGYINKDSIDSVSEVKDLGHGLRIVVEQRHLLPISDLLNYDKSL
jgi:hypothetical protein